MNDDPIDCVPSFDRVSVAAVLVREGEDATSALSDAGIIDPIVVEVMFDDGQQMPPDPFGGGITANLTAVLEMEQTDQRPDEQSSRGATGNVAIRGPSGTSANLPPAFGGRPLAPVRPGGA